jgi:hypothetical protein
MGRRRFCPNFWTQVSLEYYTVFSEVPRLVPKNAHAIGLAQRTATNVSPGVTL